MPRRIGEDTTQITLRLETALLKRAERLAPRISPADITLMRSDVLRAAIARGLKGMEEDSAKKSPRRKTKAKATARA
jgi:hypothetical protein